MPVLDWTRTHLYKPLADGSTALAFEIDAMRAFDLFVLGRSQAHEEYTTQAIAAAQSYFDTEQGQQAKALLVKGLSSFTGS